MKIPVVNPFTAQAWRDQDLVMQINGLSYDAARHIAQTHAGLGETGRIICDGEDYVEVFTPDGGFRSGTISETTLVKCPESVCRLAIAAELGADI